MLHTSTEFLTYQRGAGHDPSSPVFNLSKLYWLFEPFLYSFLHILVLQMTNIHSYVPLSCSQPKTHYEQANSQLLTRVKERLYVT
jgi:hypothetical protein